MFWKGYRNTHLGYREDWHTTADLLCQYYNEPRGQVLVCVCECACACASTLASEHVWMFEFVCVCVFVCRWQLQPQTDWHLAVAVVLTAELTALIRTHPNQKETTPVHCSWAQPRKGWGGGRRGRMEERKTQSEVWMKAGSERDGGLVIRSRWKEWWGQREVEGERWRERGGEEEFRHR